MIVGVHGAWWFPQSSKLMRPDSVGLGGFDSHALPPRRGAFGHDHAGATPSEPVSSPHRIPCWSPSLPTLVLALALTLPIAAMPAPVFAQRAADTRAGVSDTTRPPITPTRAFLYSLAIPGLGQARLDRPLVGAGFFFVEAFAIALVHRTADDLRIARSYRRDSIPLRFAVDQSTGVVQLDGKGNAVVAAWEPSYYSDAMVRARRLQLEDWSAVLVFNHLIAGAEAFVAAQLWDLPQHVKLRASPVRGGLALSASFGGR